MSGGFALFPFGRGDSWAATGVEDDTEKGVWHDRGASIDVIALFETIFSVVQEIDELQFLELLQDLFTIFDMIRDAVDTDDMLQPAIGLTRGFFEDTICTRAKPWNTSISVGTGGSDLEFTGHLACLSSSLSCQ
jgi:hypothetical protein